MEGLNWVDKWLAKDNDRISVQVINDALEKAEEEIKNKADKYGRGSLRDKVNYKDGVLQVGIYTIRNTIIKVGYELNIEKVNGEKYPWSLQIQKDKSVDRVKLILIEDIGREENKIVGEHEHIKRDNIFYAIGELFKVNEI
ncbi:hypothetical protein [uncultured Clostridium sp.]|uniref:hypothetical protein n=1 Tax=uncultured Clostridium sp. TaxID=59620 RepID=UPI00260F877B|nr:hypothetical protein [uncultured Clostridium sp.]